MIRKMLNWIADLLGYEPKEQNNGLVDVCNKQQHIINALMKAGVDKTVIRLPDPENQDEYRGYLAEMYSLYQNQQVLSFFVQQERALISRFRSDPSKENSDLYKGGLLALESMRNELAEMAKRFMFMTTQNSEGSNE